VHFGDQQQHLPGTNCRKTNMKDRKKGIKCQRPKTRGICLNIIAALNTIKNANLIGGFSRIII
jgi:hypothetical protein